MGTLEAKLPFGPAQKVEYDQRKIGGMSNDERYNLFIGRMEAEVTSLMGMDGVEMEASPVGRRDLPLCKGVPFTMT